MKTLLKITLAITLLASLAAGQTILSSTTLGAAITTTTQTNITLASTSTMQNKGGAGNQINTVLYVDHELMYVTSVTDSTHVIVQRATGIGAGGRPMTHSSGAIVLFSLTSGSNPAPSFFSNVQPVSQLVGSCTSSQLMVLPLVYVFSGDVQTCMGSKWVIVNSPKTPVLGSVYTVPAGAIVPTGSIFLTDTGTAAATSITLPAGWAPGMCLTIIPGGAFTWTTAGNIRAAGTAVAGKATFFCWDGAKWDASI